MKMLFWSCFSLLLAGVLCQQEFSDDGGMTTIRPEDPKLHCNVEVCFMLKFRVKNTGNTRMSYQATCRITDNEGNYAYQEDITCLFKIEPGIEREVKINCKLNVPADEFKTYNIDTRAKIEKYSPTREVIMEREFETSFTVTEEKIDETVCVDTGEDPDYSPGPDVRPGGIGGDCGISGPTLMPGNTEGAFNYTGVLRWYNPTDDWQLIPYQYRASNSLNEIYEKTGFTVPPNCAGTIYVERPFNVRSILNRKFDIYGWWAGCWPPHRSSKLEKFSHKTGVYPEP